MPQRRALLAWLPFFVSACGGPADAQPTPDPAATADRIDPAALAYVSFPWPAGSLRASAVVLGCAHACVLEGGGAVSCWGRDEFGELGDGASTTRATPAPVSGLPPVVEIAAGCAFTCARTETGEVWCWGGADLGEIGDGDRAGRRTHPVRVPGITGARSIASSGTGTCAVLDDAGHASCWGTFDDHPGAPLAGDSTRPRALATTLREPASLVAASPFTSCVIARDETISCWGHREVAHVDVAPVDPAHPMAGIAHAHDVAGGAHMTCASDPAGVACWGIGLIAFGLGGTEPLPPIRIAGMPARADVSVGDDFVCGTAAGATRCAGYGELVDATGRVHPLGPTATAVPALDGLHGVVAGSTMVCGLDAHGGVRCVAWLSGHEGEPPAPPS